MDESPTLEHGREQAPWQLAVPGSLATRLLPRHRHPHPAGFASGKSALVRPARHRRDHRRIRSRRRNRLQTPGQQRLEITRPHRRPRRRVSACSRNDHDHQKEEHLMKTRRSAIHWRNARLVLSLLAVTTTILALLTPPSAVAMIAPPEPFSKHCGTACNGRNPYVPNPEFHNIRCADSTFVISNSYPTNENSSQWDDPNMRIAVDYSTMCGTMWAIITNRKAIGRISC